MIKSLTNGLPILLAALTVLGLTAPSWGQTPSAVRKGGRGGDFKTDRVKKALAEIDRISSKASPSEAESLDWLLMRSRSAINNIANAGPEAVPEIETVLSNPDSNERTRAVVCDALGAIGDNKAIAVLGRVLSDSTQPPFVRTSAGRAIVGKKGPGVEAAIKGVVSDKTAPRELRASVMRQVGIAGMEDIDWLAQVAQGEGLGLPMDSKAEISQEEYGLMLNAQRALGKSTNPKATGVLIGLVGKYPANSLLIQALAKKKDPRAVPVLIDALKNESSRGLSRHDAAAALGELKAADAVDPLIEIIEKARDESLVSAAAVALGKIGDKRALPALERLVGNLRDDPRFPQSYWEQAKKGHGYIPPIEAALEQP